MEGESANWDGTGAGWRGERQPGIAQGEVGDGEGNSRREED